MLDKIVFTDGVLVRSSFLNEVQKGSTINPNTTRADFYEPLSEIDHISWQIGERDSIKDWEISSPRVDPETNIGRLAHDGLLLGCTNCDADSLLEIELLYNSAPTTTRKLLNGDVIAEELYGVIVNAGKVLDAELNVVSWDTSVVVIDSESSINYIYYSFDEAILVANSTLPSRVDSYTPLAKIEMSDVGIIDSYTDLRQGVYIDSLLYRSNFLKNTDLLNVNAQIDVWERAVVDTANGEVIISLPDNPANSDVVGISDAAGTFDQFPITIVASGGKKINNSFEPIVLNKKNAHTNLFFFEPLNSWFFSDEILSESIKALGEFVSCGGWECIGATTALECPSGELIPPVFPFESEGTYYYNQGKCFKQIKESIAVFADGEGGFIKIHNSARCERVPIISEPKRQTKSLYVNLELGDDNIQNEGTRERPFKTPQRALLEASRRNSEFSTISIQLDPETYYVDNHLGSNLESLQVFDTSGLYFRTYTDNTIGFVGDNYIITSFVSAPTSTPPRGLEVGRVIYSESGANAVITKVKRKTICTNDCGWILYLKYINGTFVLNERLYYDNFSVLNSEFGGVIVPNGVSITSSDAAKTVIRPFYVPNSSQASILKLGGNTILSNLTISDNEMQARTHHRLKAVSFVSEYELDGYYSNKLDFLYEDDKFYVPIVDINESIVGIMSEDRTQDKYENLTGTPDDLGDFTEYSNFIYYPGKIKFAGFYIPDINSIRGTSPQIQHCAIRSNFGLNGIEVDGSLVRGTKSIVASHVSIECIQIDPSCFENDSYYNFPTASVNPKRLRESFRSFGIKALNMGYAYVNNSSVVSSADHYKAESGGEVFCANSLSKYGDDALVSNGYSSVALPQDYSNYVDLGLNYLGTRISHIKKPLPLQLDTKEINTGLLLDVYATSLAVSQRTGNRYRLYVRNNPLETSLGNFTYTYVEENGDVQLSAGTQAAYRNYFCFDSIEIIATRSVKSTFFVSIDALELSSNPDIPNTHQIFKYDENPPAQLTPLTGVYNLNAGSRTFAKSDSSTLPVDVQIGSFFYINNDKSVIYTITNVDRLTNIAFFDKAISGNITNATITITGTDYLGGLWYVDVVEGIPVSLYSEFRPLSEGITKLRQNSRIYTFRDIDTRADDERIYEVYLTGFREDLELRAPQEDYILEVSREYDSPLNTDPPLVLRNVKLLETAGKYSATVVYPSTTTVYPALNYDNPQLTENPNDSPTKLTAEQIASHEKFNGDLTDLAPGTVLFEVSATDNLAFAIELRKPSTIRATSHVWEFVGHLYYDSALPSVIRNHYAAEEYLYKLIQSNNGGRVLASGTTDMGKVIIENQYYEKSVEAPVKLNESGANTESLINLISDNYAFNSLNITDTLSLGTDAKAVFNEDTSISISPSTTIRNFFNDIITESNSEYGVYAKSDSAGIVQLATPTQVVDGTLDNVAVTPQGLQQKVASNSQTGLVKLTTNSELSGWVNSNAGLNPNSVVTNTTLAHVLGAILGVNVDFSDIYINLDANTSGVAVGISDAIYTHGTYISLWKAGQWRIVNVPNGAEFVLADIGVNEHSETFDIYAKVNPDLETFELECIKSSLTSTTRDPDSGVIVNNDNKELRYVGSVHTVSGSGAVYSTKIIAGGRFGNTDTEMPQILLSNFYNQKSLAINLIFDDPFPGVDTPMTNWDSPAAANPAFDSSDALYTTAPSIVFVSSKRESVRAECTAYVYSTADTGLSTHLGINIGTAFSTSSQQVAPTCLIGITNAIDTTIRASLSVEVEKGAHELVYVFKVNKPSVSDPVVLNYNAQSDESPYGMSLILNI
jgi:hypothetical protein